MEILLTGTLAIVLFVMSCFQFMEKGFLFNNAYIYANKKERETMNKKPHYRQSAIVFLGSSAIFLIITVEIISKTGWLNYVMFGLMFLLVVFAIVSSVTINKKNNK